MDTIQAPTRIGLTVLLNIALLENDLKSSNNMDQILSEIYIERLKFKSYLLNFQGPLHV